MYELEPRNGFKVYVSATAHVCLNQWDPMARTGDPFVFHADEIPLLIASLRAALKEARAEKKELDEHDN